MRLSARAGLGLVLFLGACHQLAPFRDTGDTPGPTHPTFMPEPAGAVASRPRARADIDAVLAAGAPPPQVPGPMNVLLVAGAKDHGPGEHDYPAWQRAWGALLGRAPSVTVRAATDWPSDGDFAWADVIVAYSSNPGWSAARGAALDAYLERGKGFVAIHWAINGRSAAEALAGRIGFAWKDKRSRFRHGAVDVSFAGAGGHSIVRGFTGLALDDEVYWRLTGDEDATHVLASGVEEGGPQPLLWTTKRKKGRVFVSVLGHNSATFNDPLFRVLLLRGISWAAGQQVDRLSALATVGVVTTP